MSNKVVSGSDDIEDKEKRRTIFVKCSMAGLCTHVILIYT